MPLALSNVISDVFFTLEDIKKDDKQDKEQELIAKTANNKIFLVVNFAFDSESSDSDFKNSNNSDSNYKEIESNISTKGSKNSVWILKK